MTAASGRLSPAGPLLVWVQRSKVMARSSKLTNCVKITEAEMISQSQARAIRQVSSGIRRHKAYKAPFWRRFSDGCLQPRESSSPVVLLDVAVVFIGRKVGDDAGDAVGKPPGVADRKEVFQAVPRSDRSLNVGEIELPGGVQRAV